jgi:hypothetical protein
MREQEKDNKRTFVAQVLKLYVSRSLLEVLRPRCPTRPRRVYPLPPPLSLTRGVELGNGGVVSDTGRWLIVKAGNSVESQGRTECVRKAVESLEC